MFDIVTEMSTVFSEFQIQGLNWEKSYAELKSSTKDSLSRHAVIECSVASQGQFIIIYIKFTWEKVKY